MNQLRNIPNEDPEKINLQQELDQLRAEMARGQQGYFELQEQLVNTQNANQNLQAKVTSHESEINRLTEDKSDIHAMWLQRDLKYTQDRVAELEKNIQREQSEKSQLNEKITTEKNQHENTIFEISKELNEKKQQIEQKNDHIDTIQQKISKLQEKHEKSRDQKDELRRQIYEL